MNFREHFEEWHEKKYGYIGKFDRNFAGIFYRTASCQQRWEAWQGCADWHTQQKVQKPLGEDK